MPSFPLRFKPLTKKTVPKKFGSSFHETVLEVEKNVTKDCSCQQVVLKNDMIFCLSSADAASQMW